LAVTARKDDAEMLEVLAPLEHHPTRLACEGERLFLSELGGGCQVPAGAYTTLDENANTYSISGFISSLDGSLFLRAEETGSLEDSGDISMKLARRLLDSGGEEILADIRQEVS